MKLTRDQRIALTEHPDADIAAYLTAIETGRVGVIYEGGRGASIKPRGNATLVSYQGTLSKLYEFLQRQSSTGDVSWADVTEAQLEDYLHRTLSGGPMHRGIATATQNRTCIRGFYKYLRAYDRVPFTRPDDDPSAFVRIDPDRLRRADERQPITDADWLAVIRSPRLATDDRLALGLGYYCGLRREEIVTVAPRAIDPLHKRILFVDRKGGKTKTGLEYGELVELLCDERPEVAHGARDWVGLVEMYARYRDGENTLVPDHGVANVGQRFNDRLTHHILKDAGLARDAFTPHSLRHSFGTNMALCGLDLHVIADQMSHTSTETTMRYVNMAGQIKAFRKRNRAANEVSSEPVISLVRRARDGA